MISTSEIINFLQAKSDFLPEDLLIVLGPTASGKTKLAVKLAQKLDAEIISADSRQVYRQMDIGTGKDLDEYQNIPYHLIDIVNPGDKYNITRFQQDFYDAFQQITQRGKRVIVCGGTGFYIQSLLTQMPYSSVPANTELRSQLTLLEKEELLFRLQQMEIPTNFEIDLHAKKRLIRAIEIIHGLKENPTFKPTIYPTYTATLLGLNPSLEVRRQRITTRLQERLANGMIEEVQSLLTDGTSFADMEYYGLEYKYISYYLQGKLSEDELFRKLETEIHRYAKRQMTYFRKMEKDGIPIHWVEAEISR